MVVHLADAAVRWVATSELEDPTPYLEGGEVVLTGHGYLCVTVAQSESVKCA